MTSDTNKKNDRKWLYFAIFTISIYFQIFYKLDIMRLNGWGYSTIDLGNFNHFIWNTSQGNWWQTSVNYPYSEESHRLGIHFSVLSVLIAAPIYAFFPSPDTLVFLHVFAMSASAFVVYKTVLAIGIKPKEAFLWLLVYLLNPITLYATLFSFQDHSFAVLIISIGMLAIVGKNLKLLVISCILLALCKEHYGASIIGFAVLYYHQTKRLKPSLILGACGLTILASVLLIIMPYFSTVDSHYMLSNNIPKDLPYGRYQWVKLPFPNNIARGIEILTSDMNLTYYKWILIPMALLPIPGFMFLLPAGADLSANMLAGVYVPKMITLYHSSAIIPCLIIASVKGSLRVRKHFPSLKNKFAPVCIVICGFAMMLNHVEPVLSSILLSSDEHMVWADDPKVDRLKTFLTPEKRLRVTNGLGVHLGQREFIVPLRAENSGYDTLVARLAWQTFKASGIPMSTIRIDVIEKVVNDPNWGVTYWEDPFIVIEKNKPNVIDETEIANKFNILKQQYVAIRKSLEERGYIMDAAPPKI
jgi:uncharacterized membrane protein